MAMLKSKKLKDGLKKRAEENSQVTIGTSKEQQVLKKGIPFDNSVKHFSENPVVGVSIGGTFNMDNYESLRVDTWMTDSIHSDETPQQAYQRVTKIVSETLQDILSEYKDG